MDLFYFRVQLLGRRLGDLLRQQHILITQLQVPAIHFFQGILVGPEDLVGCSSLRDMVS
jgi:hypothetical protein